MADTTVKHVKDTLLDEAGNKTVFYNRNTVKDVMVGDSSEESIQGHINYLATCDTAADVAEKVITVGDGTTDVLKAGVSFDITFTNGNSVDAATVSVNGSDAVSLTDVTATTIKAGQTVHFVYNGTGLITSGGSGSGTKVTTENIVGEGTTGEKYVAMVDGADDNSEITFDKKTKVTDKGLETEVGASTVQFTDQSAEANTDYRTSSALTSGENLATGFAKLKKILAGLGSVAFKPSIGTTELDTTLAEAYNNRLAKTDLYEGLDYATAGEKALDAKAGLTLQNGLTELNSKVPGISFGKDASGNWGYKVDGADTVIPFKSGVEGVYEVYSSSLNRGTQVPAGRTGVLPANTEGIIVNILNYYSGKWTINTIITNAEYKSLQARINIYSMQYDQIFIEVFKYKTGDINGSCKLTSTYDNNLGAFSFIFY